MSASWRYYSASPERTGRYLEPQKLPGGSWKNASELNKRDYSQPSQQSSNSQSRDGTEFILTHRDYEVDLCIQVADTGKPLSDDSFYSTRILSSPFDFFVALCEYPAHVDLLCDKFTMDGMHELLPNFVIHLEHSGLGYKWPAGYDPQSIVWELNCLT